MMAVDDFLKGNGSRFFVGYSPDDDALEGRPRTRSRKKRNESGFQIFEYQGKESKPDGKTRTKK